MTFFKKMYPTQDLSITKALGGTSSILPNNVISNASYSCWDLASLVQNMYHNGMLTPYSFGTTATYKGNPNTLVLNVELIGQTFFFEKRIHMFNIDESYIMKTNGCFVGTYGWP